MADFAVDRFSCYTTLRDATPFRWTGPSLSACTVRGEEMFEA
jgi:hypothetical protein